MDKAIKSQIHIEFDPDKQFEVTYHLPHEHKDGKKHLHIGFVFPATEIIFCFDTAEFHTFVNKINMMLVEAHLVVLMDEEGFTEIREDENGQKEDRS